MVGNEDEGGGGVPLDRSHHHRARPTLVRPTLRAPTADEPLRVYIGGDSIIRDAGDAFLNLASDSPLFETTLHYENATGLTRPDFYDWPAAFAEDMETHRPEVAFILFGGNDSQGILGPERRGLRGSERPAVARGVRPPGGGRDGHPPRRRPDRVLGRPPADAGRGLRRPRRHHERDLPRGGREPSVDDLPRHCTRSSATNGATTWSASPIGAATWWTSARRTACTSASRAPRARPRDARPDRRGDPGEPRGASTTTAGG